MARRKTDDLVREALAEMLPGMLAEALNQVQQPAPTDDDEPHMRGTNPRKAARRAAVRAETGRRHFKSVTSGGGRKVKAKAAKAKLIADSFEIRRDETKVGSSNIYFWDSATDESCPPPDSWREALKANGFRYVHRLRGGEVVQRWYGFTAMLPKEILDAE